MRVLRRESVFRGPQKGDCSSVKGRREEKKMKLSFREHGKGFGFYSEGEDFGDICAREVI